MRPVEHKERAQNLTLSVAQQATANNTHSSVSNMILLLRDSTAVTSEHRFMPQHQALSLWMCMCHVIYWFLCVVTSERTCCFCCMTNTTILIAATELMSQHSAAVSKTMHWWDFCLLVFVRDLKHGGTTNRCRVLRSSCQPSDDKGQGL